jgi:hypothetical protein
MNLSSTILGLEVLSLFFAAQPGEAIDGPSQHNVWHDRQEDRDGQRFAGINPMSDFYLIDDIQNDCKDKDLAHSPPSKLYQFLSMLRVRDYSPEIRRISQFCIFYSVDYRKNGCHQRLYDQPEMKRPV